MYRFVLVLSAGVLLAGVVQAQEILTEKTAVRTATISGTASSPVAGACDATGYDAVCPDGTPATNCSCVTIASAKVTGNLAGNGTAVVKLTLDNGNDATSSPGCKPVFGTAALTTKLGKTSRTETLNLLGASCHQFNSKSDNMISGGFGIAPSPLPSPAASGWGTLKGTQNPATNNVQLHLSGPITE